MTSILRLLVVALLLASATTATAVAALADPAGAPRALAADDDDDVRGPAGSVLGDDDDPNDDSGRTYAPRPKPRPRPEPDDDAQTESPAPDPASPGNGPEGGPAPSELAPAAPPVLARSVSVAPESGTVLVRLPGAEAVVALEAAASLPVGATVDTRAGRLTLTSVRDRSSTQTAVFGGAVFRIAQARAKRPVTTLKLRGGSFRDCPAPGRASASAARSKTVRSLWGKGKGRFTTKGRNSAATVRGTHWLTEDRCDGTLTRVVHGKVAVRDFARDKTVLVGAGERYLARAK